MGHSERQTADYLSVLDTASLKKYSFFQLLELLAKKYDFDLEKLDQKPLDKSLFLFKTNAGLGFPASEISSIKAKERGLLIPQYEIEVNFLGLHGSSSPLPGFLLEEIAHEFAHKSGIRHEFLDFFNHRLNACLHQIWRKYRYYIQFKIDGKDRFSQKVYSFTGLNDPAFRREARLEVQNQTPEQAEHSVNWGKLLSFSGLVASRSRSPSIVANIVAYYFGLSQVKFLEWQFRLVDIAPEQLNVLGVSNVTLGEDFVIGSRVSTYSSKFVILISDLTEEVFNFFLPQGKFYFVLKTLVAFLVREQMTYDLHLGLRQKEIPVFKLEKDNKLFLGWSTFMSKNLLLTESVVSIKGEL
jgi:type VI secretion system protein ImpH